MCPSNAPRAHTDSLMSNLYNNVRKRALKEFFILSSKEHLILNMNGSQYEPLKIAWAHRDKSRNYTPSHHLLAVT